MLIYLRWLFTACCAMSYAVFAIAQTIDGGRGNLPLTVPANYQAATATPLIILLHGFGTSGTLQENYLGLSRLADQYGFIFIAPDGTQDPTGRRYWNATPACCDFFNSNADDVGYITRLINEIKARYNIDARRVYLVGHSNGGFMSYQVAYRFPGTIAAVASLAGASHIEQRPAPGSPVHILQIHGTLDTTIQYGGGSNLGFQYPAAMTSVTTWAGYNGCTTSGTSGATRDLVSNLAGNETTTLLFTSGCRTGGSAELWTMNLAGHIPAITTGFAAQVVEWLYAHPKSEWPAVYSGVRPASALGLSVNNIGVFHSPDAMIYSCLQIQTGGQPAPVNGVTRFDIGLELVSLEQGTVRLLKSRPFNTANARDGSGAVPDCSGVFETTTNSYSDTIQSGAQTLRVSFLLTDAASLIFRLSSYSELK